MLREISCCLSSSTITSCALCSFSWASEHFSSCSDTALSFSVTSESIFCKSLTSCSNSTEPRCKWRICCCKFLASWSAFRHCFWASLSCTCKFALLSSDLWSSSCRDCSLSRESPWFLSKSRIIFWALNNSSSTWEPVSLELFTKDFRSSRSLHNADSSFCNLATSSSFANSSSCIIFWKLSLFSWTEIQFFSITFRSSWVFDNSDNNCSLSSAILARLIS